VEYFCAAKPQKRNLKAVQGAKRLMLQRLVKFLMVCPNYKALICTNHYLRQLKTPKRKITAFSLNGNST